MHKIWIEASDPSADPEVIYQEYVRQCDAVHPHGAE